mmetsp:Transcript_105572/g.297054  ORF Transcript_105572/g.297054 Transcript_105572/m.297054 type:complete len:255 (-) Transcript_105572:938-1702(-)
MELLNGRLECLGWGLTVLQPCDAVRVAVLAVQTLALPHRQEAISGVAHEDSLPPSILPRDLGYVQAELTHCRRCPVKPGIGGVEVVEAIQPVHQYVELGAGVPIDVAEGELQLGHHEKPVRPILAACRALLESNSHGPAPVFVPGHRGEAWVVLERLELHPEEVLRVVSIALVLLHADRSVELATPSDAQPLYELHPDCLVERGELTREQVTAIEQYVDGCGSAGAPNLVVASPAPFHARALQLIGGLSQRAFA